MNKDQPKKEPGLFFKNQPSYTHFNKTFDDPSDALFQHLNEVHPIFMKQNEKYDFDGFRVLLDPRTKKEVKQILYDYTAKGSNYIEVFRSLHRSQLNKRDHLACLRVLTAWQEYAEIGDVDVVRWRSLQPIRTAEKLLFDKFVKEYEQSKKATIYAPAERLVQLYKRFYGVKLKQLMREYNNNLTLNTHAGIPMPNCHKSGLTNSNAQIENVRLVRRQGWVPVLGDYTRNFQLLNARLANYMDYYVNNVENVAEPEWNVSLDEEEQLMHHFYVPLESMLFLLTAGQSPDLPTEMALEIEDGNDTGLKVIKFKEPLPPRNCGWYTHKLVIENAFQALQSISEETQWLYVENNSVSLEEKVKVAEIDASQQIISEFKVTEFKEYLESISKTHEQINKADRLELLNGQVIKTNNAIIEWSLNTDKDNFKTQFRFFTRLKMPPAEDPTGTKLLSSYALKLEYKTQFGAEVMTKYELLAEWFRLKLFSQCNGFSDQGLSIRIAAHNLSIQLQHTLMIASVEHQLKELYQIEMPQLLGSLAETLQLLTNMATGKHFLRFNPKYPDKLLLAAPSTEITPNTVYLHSLINVEPSDMAFMTSVQHLPISDFLCTAVHKKCKIMPCAFKPSVYQITGRQKRTFIKIRSDEESVQRRLHAKMAGKAEREEDYKRLRKARKRKMRAKKLMESKKLEQEEAAKSTELERLINEC